LLSEDALQQLYPLREVFNALRWIVRAGVHWRMMPHDLLPRPVVRLVAATPTPAL
jgi:transposase